VLGCFPGFLPRPAKRLSNYRQERRAIRLFGSNHGNPEVRIEKPTYQALRRDVA
jgi:hypothetical protein